VDTNSRRSPDAARAAAAPAASAGTPAPRVSVIVPTYKSDATLRACLSALAAQTFTGFELLIIDSTPDSIPDSTPDSAPAGDVTASATATANASANRIANGHRSRTRAIVEAAPLAVRYIESPVQLVSHAARNLGARQARGTLLVFTDPDIYPDPGWLAALVCAHDARGGVIFGPLACAGRRWFDIGVHLCKFAICLPERDARPVRYGWSGNMLCDRSAFDAVGGFPDRQSHGDTLLSANLRRAGVPLWLEPTAVVRHDHEAIRLRPFLRERFDRGAELAGLAADGSLTGSPWTRAQRLRRVVTTLIWPLKVARACLDVARGARRAGLTRDFVLTIPVIVAGQTAWVLGASLRYLADGWAATVAQRREARG
jgi:GT2 family glycosyltransferase